MGACFGADVVTSNAGLAMCGHLGIASVGFSYTWLTRTVQLLGPACDLGPFVTATGGGFLSMGGGRSVTLPAGLPVTAFAVRGRGAPPRVTLTGPRGKPGRTLVFQDKAHDTTFVAVASPAAGRWKVSAAAGSAPIVSVRNAAGLPKPSVSARVSGPGRARVLSYRVKPLAGQRVVFVERGARTARVLGAAKGARGSIRFAPAAGPSGRRSIVAEVSQNGLPRATLTVARYAAPAPLKVGRPGRLAAHRTATALRFTWKPAARAVAYRIDVRTSDHRHLRPFLRARSYVVPRVRKGDRVTVTLVALDAANHAGQRRSAVVVAR